MSQADELPDVNDYAGWQVGLSAVVAVVVTAVSVWWVSRFGPFYELLFRVDPATTGPARGVGADWIFGNTLPSLDFLIALVHALDVILGLFVLFLVFVHWVAFRRLAGRMRGPADATEETVVADGGDDDEAGGEPG